MTPPPHRPACILGGHASVLTTQLRRLITDLDTLKDHASHETMLDTSRIVALLDLASDELYRLAANEQDAHPDLHCAESEGSETAGERVN